MRISQMANNWPSYYLNRATNNMNKSAEKLASGKRINTAADDPSGMAKLQTMKMYYNTARVNNEGLESARDYAKVKDNALQQINEIAGKISELQLADNVDEDVIKVYSDEISNIISTTSFNGNKVFNDSDISIGGIDFKANTLTSSVLKFGTSDETKASIDAITKELGMLGATEYAIDSRINVNNSTMANMEAAISRIEDVDVEKEMTEYNKQYVLQQMASSMISKQNQNMTSILDLLG